MNVFDILDVIASTSSKNDKFELLKQNTKNKQLIDIIDAVFNYRRLFYISKIETPPPTFTYKDLHADFCILLNQLETRAIVGNEAKSTVYNFLAKCTQQQQDWYIRILRKDLKAGFSAKTAAKAGFNIHIFEVMLAKDGKENSNLIGLISKGVYVSPKFDGYRCLAHIKDGNVLLYTRAGTIFENFPHIEASLAKCFPVGEYVFDGEIMSENFQNLQKSAFAHERSSVTSDEKYYIFGYVPADEWNTQNFKMKTKQRLKELTNLSVKFDSNLVLVNQVYTTEVNHVYQLEQAWISAGYEGAMVLPADIPYFLGKKSNKLMKFKTFQSWDCEIIGFYEGKEDTKHAGRLGGFIVRQENGLECRGAGEISDEDREYIWKNQSQFIGRIAEFSYQNLTDDGIMRFPQFKRWRDTSSHKGEKI